MVVDNMIKLLHADNFFYKNDIDKLLNIANNLKFEEKEYGYEILNFNFIIPELDPIFSKFVGEEVKVDKSNSGVFCRPKLNIHFESFNSLSDWIFIVALEPTTFNLYYHVQSGFRSALEGYKFNYKNFLNWNYYTNILLEPNDGIIFKPWLFHSLQDGLIQVYRLTGKKNE